MSQSGCHFAVIDPMRCYQEGNLGRNALGTAIFVYKSSKDVRTMVARVEHVVQSRRSNLLTRCLHVVMTCGSVSKFTSYGRLLLSIPTDLLPGGHSMPHQRI